MKKIIILFIVLAIILIGAIFYLLNQDTIISDVSEKNTSLLSEEKELPRQISVSTQEELFQEIRSSVNEHLNEKLN